MKITFLFSFFGIILLFSMFVEQPHLSLFQGMIKYLFYFGDIKVLCITFWNGLLCYLWILQSRPTQDFADVQLACQNLGHINFIVIISFKTALIKIIHFEAQDLIVLVSHIHPFGCLLLFLFPQDNLIINYLIHQLEKVQKLLLDELLSQFQIQAIAYNLHIPGLSQEEVVMISDPLESVHKLLHKFSKLMNLLSKIGYCYLKLCIVELLMELRLKILPCENGVREQIHIPGEVQSS